MSTPGADPRGRYLDAKDKVQRLEQALAQMGARLSQIGGALQATPVRVAINEPGFPQPESIAMGAPISLAPEEWPTWDRFRDTLADYYTAQVDFRRAEYDLSPSDRKTLGLS